MLADVVEKTHCMVLDHHVVRGESLLNFVDPSLDYVSTALPAEVLVGVCVVSVCV